MKGFLHGRRDAYSRGGGTSVQGENCEWKTCKCSKGSAKTVFLLREEWMRLEETRRGEVGWKGMWWLDDRSAYWDPLRRISVLAQVGEQQRSKTWGKEKSLTEVWWAPCGNIQRPIKWDKKRLYSNFARARESATITWVWQRLKAGRGLGKFYTRKQWKLQVCCDWRLLAWRSWKCAN